MSRACIQTAVRAAIFGLTTSAMIVSSALADGNSACKLIQLTTLELVTEPDGLVSVPATIDGLNGLMAVDTGGINSVIGQSVANRLGLKSSLGPRATVFGGVPITQMARPRKLQLGQITSTDIPMMVAPTSILLTDIIGMLAPNYLSHFDVEFDFAAGRFNLYSQEHCPANVVYWTKSPYADVPFDLDAMGHIVVTATLDGKEIHALVDTGSDRSIMTMDQAKSLFGIKIGDPELKLLGVVIVNGKAPSPTYHYPFSSLDFKGVHIQKPDIDILVGRQFDVGQPQIVLGILTLRQLHLYIAYKEKVIYLTPAEAR